MNLPPPLHEMKGIQVIEQELPPILRRVGTGELSREEAIKLLMAPPFRCANRKRAEFLLTMIIK